MRLVFMLFSDPRRNFGSTSSLLSRYTSWKGECVSRDNREVVPKLHLKSEQNMETNTSTHPEAVQKNVDNPKQIQS
jgi:hypothetical protein